MGDPVYSQLAGSLRDRITNGDLSAARRLPSEAALSAEFGVSRTTLRRALEMLEKAGVVRATPGLGWFVDDPATQIPDAK